MTTWGTDDLTRFLDAAYSNQGANVANFAEPYGFIQRVHHCLSIAGKNLINPKPIMTGVLFLRSQYAYKAAAGMALSGQVVEAFAMMHCASNMQAMHWRCLLTRALRPYSFGDINRMFREYIILQVCKITDHARNVRKNDNHTIAFLLQHYDFSTALETKRRLGQLDVLLQAFREKLLPARNKIIAHSNRNTSWPDALLAERRRANGTSFGAICKS